MMAGRAGILAVIAATIVSAQAGSSYQPARYRTGRVPASPVQAVGGGQVILVATVSRGGVVAAIDRLRTTPPYTSLLENAVRGWLFVPAAVGARRSRSDSADPVRRMPVASKVLITAVYRPPALYGPTLGELPRDVASPAEDCAYPLNITEPPYPPLAVAGGVVFVEARVDANGEVAEANILQSTPPFDEPALAALKTWQFRPAHVGGVAVPAYAYVLFGFPAPTALADHAGGVK